MEYYISRESQFGNKLVYYEMKLLDIMPESEGTGGKFYNPRNWGGCSVSGSKNRQKN